jgi:hypothetical protein
MTANQLVALCVRIGGIFIFLTMLPLLPQGLLILTGTSNPGPMQTWWILTIQVIWLAAALCMIAFPHVVASNWLGSHRDQPLSLAWTKGEAENVVFTLLGLMSCLWAARECAYWLALYLIGSAIADERKLPAAIFRPDQYAGMAGTAVELLLGLWLLFGASGLRRLLRWARHGGPAGVSVASHEP